MGWRAKIVSSTRCVWAFFILVVRHLVLCSTETQPLDLPPAVNLSTIYCAAAVACSFSPEALTSLASFTESLSLCLGFLARANRLSAQAWNAVDGSMVPPARHESLGRRAGSRRRSSVGGRRRTTGSGDGVENGAGWTVAVDLRKVDALLTMLKQLDDQESAGHLMGAGNQVRLL